MLFSRKLARIKVTGVNFSELIAAIQKAQISVNFTRQSDTSMLFETSRENLPRLFDILQKKCYTYKTCGEERQNYSYLVGASIGVVLMLVVMIILTQFCFGIKVVATDADVRAKIENLLIEEKCITRVWRDIDCDSLENLILKNVPDVGMVSVSQKGMYLVVNTSLATPKPPVEPNPDFSSGIYADCDGVVSRIFVSNGTALVKVGDTVSFGDLLVAPYNLDAEGNEIETSVRADVYVYAWDSATVEFCEDSVEYARTGNFVTAASVIFGGEALSQAEVAVPYKTYESVTKLTNLSSVLPVKLETTYYYETAPVGVKKDFAAEEQALIYEAKQKVMAGVNESDVLEQKHTISEHDGKYYVSYYIKREYKVG